MCDKTGDVNDAKDVSDHDASGSVALPRIPKDQLDRQRTEAP